MYNFRSVPLCRCRKKGKKGGEKRGREKGEERGWKKKSKRKAEEKEREGEKGGGSERARASKASEQKLASDENT